MPIHQQRRLALILCFSAALGALVALSSYYDGLNADTAVALMDSFVHWTPFMWGNDRYGMLIPALTVAITNPLANVIVQNTLHVMCTALTFFFLAQFLFPGKRAFEIGLVSLAGYLALSGLPDVKEFLSPWNLYTPAMMFGCAALLVLPQSILLALIFGVTAEWTNFAIFVLLAILLFVRDAEEFSRAGWEPLRIPVARQIVFLCLITAAGFIMKAPFTPSSDHYQLLPILEALEGWVWLWHSYFADLNWTSLSLPLAPLAIGIAALIVVFWKRDAVFRRQGRALRLATAGLIASLLYALCVGGTVFAKLNGYPRRYLIPSLMVWTVAWVGMTLHLYAIPTLRRRQLQIFASAALLAIVLFRFGLPSVSNVRESLNRRFERIYSQIPERCTHVAGDYYRVWDSVLYSRLKGDRPLWGITYRANVTQSQWALDKVAHPHVCLWKDNEDEARGWLKQFGIDNLVTVTTGPEIIELEPVEELTAGH